MLSISPVVWVVLDEDFTSSEEDDESLLNRFWNSLSSLSFSLLVLVCFKHGFRPRVLRHAAHGQVPKHAGQPCDHSLFEASPSRYFLGFFHSSSDSSILKCLVKQAEQYLWLLFIGHLRVNFIRVL